MIIDSFLFDFKVQNNHNRFFLRFYRTYSTKPPIYSELEKKHGYVPDLVNISLAPPTHVEVKVIIEETNFSFPCRLVLKESVGELKNKLAKKIDLQPSQISLLLYDVAAKRHYGKQDFNIPPTRPIYSYNVHDGDEIYIRKKISFFFFF